MKSKLKTILAVDGGGRGSALVDKYLKSLHVGRVLGVPGNDLMTVDKKVKIFPKLKTTDISEIIKICKSEKVDLVDVAQDDAVAAGLVDALLGEKIRAFGPTKLAGQIEWDKAWAREFMRKFKIPSPSYKICKSQEEGLDFVEKHKGGRWFVKASGLAAGKGAIFAKNYLEAEGAIQTMKNFGEAGKIYLIEECLAGEEFSAFAIVNGKHFKVIGYAQDYKRVFDRDRGPNTGGMGCSSPPMVVDKEIESQTGLIFKKTTEALVKIERPYVGVLYLGGMIDKNGRVRVIEFNARWGDPEAQVIVPSIKNDFYELAVSTLSGNLDDLKINKDNFYRLVVTVAAKGYPTDYKKALGREIVGIDEISKVKNVKVFGAGVKKAGGKYLVSGGRLFYVVAKGLNVADARKISYNALSLTNVEGNFIHYRKDIGYRDLERFNKRG